jgi:hypothetical protein
LKSLAIQGARLKTIRATDGRNSNSTVKGAAIRSSHQGAELFDQTSQKKQLTESCIRLIKLLIQLSVFDIGQACTNAKILIRSSLREVKEKSEFQAFAQSCST